MKIQWTNAAVGDLAELRIHIAQTNPESASALAERILSAVEILIQYPDLGKAGRARGTHELVIAGTSYILIYRAYRVKVQILRVLHGRRRWPSRKRR
jgi:toxin ParE1/3/4